MNEMEVKLALDQMFIAICSKSVFWLGQLPGPWLCLEYNVLDQSAFLLYQDHRSTFFFFFANGQIKDQKVAICREFLLEQYQQKDNIWS